jgi:hypothetical protein
MNKLKMSLISIACASILTTTYGDQPSCQNQISLQLQEEGWVSSETAQVMVSIQAATSKNNVSVLIETITGKLKSLVKQSVSWRLVDLSTQKNSAGLFAVSAQLSARLSSDQLAQLQSTIDSLNKAGEQYKIEGVDYQPTLQEIAAENSRLRVLMYKDLLEQQKLINAAFPSANYQLQLLSFDSAYAGTPAPVMMYAGANTARQITANNAMPFSQHVILNASITFGSLNPACEKSDK